MTGLPFGARLTFGQARMMNSIIQIFPLVSKVGLIAATKPATGTASLGKAMVTIAWPHLAAMGQGLWFVARDGLYSCVGPTINSICGHYVEWGGHANDHNITIAQRTTIDVGNHREYCQLE
ncbi:hypothetical protein N9K58_04340 [Alphaproteobacteria bacterium]|nr:hypothetical protein [Alphaproteobacteria bacterium]